MSVKDAVYYLCIKYDASYPDVGKERIMHTLYLVAWRMAFSNNEVIQSIDWLNSPTGPYSPTIERCLREDNRYVIINFSHHGNVKKERLSIINRNAPVALDGLFRTNIDFVFAHTHKLSFAELNSAVYSTYPMLVAQKDAKMNLHELAEKYIAQKREADSSQKT